MNRHARIGLSGLAVLAASAMMLGRTATAAPRLFDIDRCNVALHEGYDAFLAPYRQVDPPPLPPGVLVVGGPSGPAELLLAPGESTEAYEIIFVIDNGKIVVTGAGDPPVRIGSKIVLLDNAEFLAWSANIHFLDRGLPRDPNDVLDAAGEGVVMLELADNASLTMAFSTVSIGETYPGYLRFIACGTSNVILLNNDFSVQNGTCEMTQTRPTTEVFPFAFDSATVTVVEQGADQTALYEVSAAGNSTVNLFDLGGPGAGAYFLVDAEVVEPVRGLVIVREDQSYTLQDAVGNGPTINAIKSGLLWGFWIEPGAKLQIEDSEIGLWFKPDGDLQIEGLHGGLWGESGVPETLSLPGPGIEVTLVDSYVIETNVYFRGGGSKLLSHSVVGDANCGGSGVCIFNGSVISGAGGDYSVVFGNALSIYSFSSQRLGFFARDDGVAVFHFTTIASHPENPAPNRFRASDRALISFQNAIFAPPIQYPDSVCVGNDLGEYTCEAEDNAAIAYATIASPGFATILSTSQSVMGTAAVKSSAESFWAFHHYDLWLDDGGGNVQFLVQGEETQVAAPTSDLCRTGTAALGFLDVTDLTPASLYTLHLGVFNQAGVMVAKTENSFVYFP